MDPFSEAWFIFCNRGRDKLKILFGDINGVWLYYRRLEKGTFKWPRPNPQGVITISKPQLHWLLSGPSLENSNAYCPLNGLEVRRQILIVILGLNDPFSPSHWALFNVVR
ncbi:IS66 family insertion sequence element accessory protein TnpB [Vibrio cholerae]|nr:IS66 family insertion sequence element accessory protein TnpB [Vibrio cholerae]ELJ8688264.1 IS66 family insertion sequence element accessory protein TnpB [Vibrio cholerae]HDZ9325808.1 IS66 family insertion sequence element accessory protein TnpB [Vibrio cholerae]